MKKFLKIIFYLFLFLVGFNLIWFGYNLRPRPVEKELWTSADLALPTRYTLYSPEEFLQKLLNPFAKLPLEIPEGLEELSNFQKAPSDYWQKSKDLEKKLGSFLETRQDAFKIYEKLLDGPEWIDPRPLEESLKPGSPQLHVINMLDMHRIAGLQIVNFSLKEDWDSASALWLKVFQKDLVWLYYSRSLISRMSALSCVSSDIQLLSLLQQKQPFVEKAEIRKALSSIDWKQLSFKRSLIAEYLYEVFCLDLILNEELPKARDYRLRKILFNRNATLKLINDRFIQYENFLQNPSLIPEKFDENMNRAQKLPKSGNRFWDIFWWVDNPGGKAIANLLFVNIADYIKEYASHEAELSKSVSKLMTPVETQPNIAP